MISYDRIKDFVSLVRDMRESQEHYAQTRSWRSFEESARLEARVDRALKWFAEEGEQI